MKNEIPSQLHNAQFSASDLVINNSTTPLVVLTGNTEDTIVYGVYVSNADGTNRRVRLRRRLTATPNHVMTVFDANVLANAGINIDIIAPNLVSGPQTFFDIKGNKCLFLPVGWELVVDTPTAFAADLRIVVEAYNFTRS